MQEISGLEKTGQNQAMKYAFITIDDVVNAVRKSFIKHGITFLIDTEDWQIHEGKFFMNLSLSFVNADNPKDRETVKALGISCQLTDTAPGKAIAYGVKNTLLKTLLIPGGKHEDVELLEEKPSAVPLKLSIPAQKSTAPGNNKWKIKELDIEIREATSLPELKAMWEMLKKDNPAEIIDELRPHYLKTCSYFT